MHSGKWETRSRDKAKIQGFGVFLVLASIGGWWMGKDSGFAQVLVTNGVIMIGAVEINHTREKVKSDNGN